MCHEVISVSKSKQKLKKEHDDDMFMSNGSSEHSIKQSNKLIKRVTYSQKLQDRVGSEPLNYQSNDDFNVGRSRKLLNDS